MNEKIPFLVSYGNPKYVEVSGDGRKPPNYGGFQFSVWHYLTTNIVCLFEYRMPHFLLKTVNMNNEHVILITATVSLPQQDVYGQTARRREKEWERARKL